MRKSLPSWRDGIRVLLDTQAVVFAYLGNLSPKVQEILSRDETDLTISAASILEIAVKNTIGQLEMPAGETRRALRELQLNVLPFEARHAFQMFTLPLHHRDPFDRMILATALVEKLPLVSGDRILRQYRGIKIIW